ncbi:DUF4942 domain-containing protein [Bradyrhizobium sp. RT10b]|uniref:DUF4942 domain-containing protein n=1 Tax=Bradyrhizobium sp. RT10b TaxID=3156331 RepID=UPI003398D139
MRRTGVGAIQYFCISPETHGERVRISLPCSAAPALGRLGSELLRPHDFLTGDHMNAHVPSLQRSLPDVVAEYDTKKAGLEDALKAFGQAGSDLQMAVTIAGVYGDTRIDVGGPSAWVLEASLLKSAWKHVYDGLNIERLASPDDKRRWKMALEKPAAFTLDNIRATFGRYIQDPRGNILRGLAEVFCGLDQAYKSHDKVKIGVKGLPKRVIIGYIDNYGSSGRDKVESILNALAAYQGKPLITHRELSAILNNETALLADSVVPATRYEPEVKVVGRGVRLRRFANKNGHMIFEPDTLRDINKALAEFYGDVLPDTTEEKPTAKQASTALSKDLQYYPTPAKVVRDIVGDLYRLQGAKVLEPSCGCGRFMDALRAAKAEVIGVEADAGRAAQARAKGHHVLHGNFLETTPEPKFDHVVMNPPFYGKHYARHVEHALKFLKPGGRLTAILPASARYDHQHITDAWKGRWSDLPVGSFSDSGTNINTTVLTMTAPTEAAR